MTSIELMTFKTEFRKIGQPAKSPTYEAFAMRVMKEYKGLQRSKGRSNCVKVLKAAIAQVFDQIRPKSSVPNFNFDAKAAHKTLLPIIKQVDISSLTVIFLR